MRRLLTLAPVVLIVVGVSSAAFAEGEKCPPGSWFCADVTAPGPAPAASPSSKPVVPNGESPSSPASPQPGNGGTTVIVNSSSPSSEEAPAAKHPSPPPPAVMTPPLYEPPPPPPPYHHLYHSEWGFNTHLEGAFMGSRNDKSDKSGMGGLGFALRARPARYFGLDFGIDFLGGKDYQGYRRSETPFTINALLFINPHDKTQAYFLGGIGWSWAHVDQNGAKLTYDYFGAQVGFGVEFRVARKVAINVDLLGFVRGRTDDAARQNPEFTDTATGNRTNTSGGGLLRGGLTFYW